MKTLILAAVLSLATTNAFATCKSDTADKKLHGAAAHEPHEEVRIRRQGQVRGGLQGKKLAGAAKTSHMKKCVADAVGT